MRTFASIFCAVALISLASPALASPVLEGSGSLSLPAVGSAGTVTVSLAGAGTGLSGYNLTLSLAPAGTAEIVSVAFPSWASMPVNGSLPAESVFVKAVDLEMGAGPGDSTISLTTVTIRATTNGEAVLTVIPVIVDDDQGSRYVLDPLQIPVQVGTGATETITPSAVSTIHRGSSPSSAGAAPLGTTVPSDTPATPAAPNLTETAEHSLSVTASPMASLPSSLPLSQEETAVEQTKNPAEAAPGFDCTTTYLAGVLIAALALLKRNTR